MDSSNAWGVSRWMVLLSLTVLAAACAGDGLVTSTGSVVCDGQPVDTGAISFHPVEGRLAPQGGQIVAGRFRVRTLPGRHRVEIRASRPKAGGVELTPGALPREQYIPARYNDESTLEVEVSPLRVNEFTFHLASNPNRSKPSLTQPP